MVGLTFDQYLESGPDFHEMRDRLCPHVHSSTFDYHHSKAFRSRHFPHAILRQVPRAIKASLDWGVIGEGMNIWPNVKIHEREFLFVSSVSQPFQLHRRGRIITNYFRRRLG